VPLPPRLKQLRTDMADQQERIDLVGESLPILGRNMDWVAHWMGNHRRLKNGVPVLLEEDPSVKAMSSRPHRSVAVDEATQVKKHVYKSIQKANTQQGEFWKQFGSLGTRLQGLKRRVKIYLAASKSAGLLQETQREELEAMAADEAIAEQDWSIFGTTEKCCKCKSGTTGWSASGKCSFCKGSVAKTKSVSSDCVKSNKKFKGNQVCANGCKTSVGLLEAEAHAAALVQTEETQRQEVEAMAADEAIAEQDWSIFGTTEKCCRCSTGTVGWSASGKCSFCKTSVAKSTSVPQECTTKSPKFAGNQVCANSCKKSVGALAETGAQALLQQAAAPTDAERRALADDEALASP